MGIDGESPSPAVTPEGLQAEVERFRLLYEIGQEFNSSLDFDALLPQVFNSVLSAVSAQGGSIWIAEGDVLRCRLAMGSASQKLVGSEVPIGEGFVGDVAQRQRTTIVSDAMRDPRFQQRVDRSSTMMTTNLMATPMVTKGITVGSIQVTNKLGEVGIFDEGDCEVLEGLAAAAAVALRNAQLHTAEKRARDLALLLEISREITSTLDLDRVLQSVVNLASRALTFDSGAVGMFDRRRLEIRAIAGQDEVDEKSDETKRLAARGAWAADREESFYVADCGAPVSDAERAFVAAFGEGLQEDGVQSLLYMPLRDEEGPLGIVMFEAERTDFATDTQRELAEILANQTTVALRNAELYNQVPLAEALGTIAKKRRALMQLPRRRRQVYAVAAVAALAAVTLVRWPLRVAGSEPTFRAVSYAEVRPLVPGIVERVMVSEGQAVLRGAPLMRLRDAELRAEREAAAAATEVAERAAAVAVTQSNPAEERMNRARVQALRREVALLDEQLAATVVRAPVSGVVLTPRTEDLLGSWFDEGSHLLTLGRTDTLELELGVRQRDIERVEPGQRLRLRVDALPQRTFEGRVITIAELPVERGNEVYFPVRALVPSPDGELKPGMVAHAKVLTGSMSIAERVLRAPARWARLAWWRMRW